MSNVKSWDNVWDDIFSNQEWGKYPSESLIQFIARNYYNLDRKRINILEVGCGTGANIWFIAREGFNAYGIDGSKVAIEKATNRITNDGITNVSLVVGDINQLPYEDNFFDAIIDNECIYSNNIANSKFILASIKKALKPGGKFYSRTFSDRMYIGENVPISSNLEYSQVSNGPLAGKGFVRLSNKESIKQLYGDFSNLSIDYLEYTGNNGAYTISEWIVIGTKENS